MNQFEGRAITCVDVKDYDTPVLTAGRFLDGDWDLLCGAAKHEDGELRIAHAYHLVEEDKITIEEIAEAVALLVSDRRKFVAV